MSHVDGVDDGVLYGVFGYSGRGHGVMGFSKSGDGVFGRTNTGAGVYGLSTWGSGGIGVVGESETGIGVVGESDSAHGVVGESGTGDGVRGYSGGPGSGVVGESETGIGMYALSYSAHGVVGESGTGDGVHGYSGSGVGVYSYSPYGNGLYAGSASYSSYAAYLDGRVYISGPLEKPSGQFKIDHPLDPANKYLCHSFVESPDMKNVYDGVVALDNKGEAEIELPDWFGALNKDFRYQLTAIGAPGPNLYIAEEIISDTTTTKHGSHDDYDSSGDNNRNNNNGSRFKIAGGTSAMKVSWQVTGIRKDPWANAHRVQVEEDKPDKERGYYIYPELYGQPEENGISRLLFPEENKARVARK